MRTYMNYSKTIIALAAFATVAATAQADDIKIVANQSVGAASISPDEIKGVFLATKTSLSDGSHVEPVLEKSGATHEGFLKAYLGKSESALETYYRSLV